MTTSTKCEFCDKRGLPLLLVRDAVAPAGAGAPLAPSLPIELAPAAAHYTKRLLRSGYVNVYDEARRRWEAYFVTADGYFFKLLQTPGGAPVVPAKPFNCPDEAHRAVASCITISDPKNASKVWIGFSDVLWTDAVRTANENIAYRKRHMTEINVKAALKGNHAPHKSLAQLDSIVAEYAMEPVQAKNTLEWSPFRYCSRRGHADRLKQECESLRPEGGVIVTLPDPAGIVQELAFLMKRNADLFIQSHAEHKRNLAASSAIDALEEAIRKQAEDGEIVAANELANQQIKANPLGHLFSESTRARTHKIREVTSAELKQAADKAWEKYAVKFSEQDRQSWLRPFGEKLAAFDKLFIAPLALAHVAWMKSLQLYDYFECNYDVKNSDSGAVYTAVITNCVIATQDKKACADLYDEWLKGDISDKKNLLLRAMVMNQDLTSKAIEAASAVNISWKQIPWDNVFAVYAKSLEQLSQGVQEISARLVVQVAGPIARMFNKIMDGSSGFRAAVMATGLISGHPVVVCEVSGTKRQFRAHLVRQLLRASGEVISESQMQRAVLAELKRQQIHGVPMEGSTKKYWLLVADKEMIAIMPSGLSPQKRAEWLARSLKTIEALEDLNLHRWRTVINHELRTGIIAGILQLVSLTKLIADEEKSLTNEKTDATARLYSGVATIVFTTSEALGNVLMQRATLGMRFGQGLASSSGTVLKFIGQKGGVAAGLVVALMDGYKAYNEYKEGANGLVVVAYIGSAVIGAGLSLALVNIGLLGAAAIPLIGILVLLLICIGFLIEHIKDNPIQDWLERCPWGKLSDQRYPDMVTEQAQLKQALK